MESRPTPTGHQHAMHVPLRRTPASRFTDPVRALTDLQTGLTQPIVEVVEEHDDGSVLVQVSVFSDNPEPSPHETAAQPPHPAPPAGRHGIPDGTPSRYL